MSLKEGELETDGHHFSFIFSRVGVTKWDKPMADLKEMWGVPNSEKLNGRTHCPGMQEWVQGDQAHSQHKNNSKPAIKYGTLDSADIWSDPFLCSLFCSSEQVSVGNHWGAQEAWTPTSHASNVSKGGVKVLKHCLASFRKSVVQQGNSIQVQS